MISVDIIIPTFERGALIREALISVQKQTYPYWKCWIVEDGESLETQNEIGEFLQDTRFQYVPGKHIGTPSGPRNRGIKQGVGDYVALLDDDDIWLPEKLEKQVACVTEHPENVLVGTNAFRWNPTEEFSPKITPKYFKKSRYWHKPVPFEAMLRSNRFITSSVMIKRDVLSLTGMFNENLKMAEDYELWLRVGSVGQMWSLSEPLLIYRESKPTFYEPLNKRDDYLYKAMLLDLVLQGTGGVSSPLMVPGNQKMVDSCRTEIDFLRKGPRWLGRLRHRAEGICSQVVGKNA